MKTNKPEFILLIMNNVIESKPQYFIQNAKKLKELLNLLLIIETNVEEKLAFKFH